MCIGSLTPLHNLVPASCKQWHYLNGRSPSYLTEQLHSLNYITDKGWPDKGLHYQSSCSKRHFSVQHWDFPSVSPTSDIRTGIIKWQIIINRCNELHVSICRHTAHHLSIKQVTLNSIRAYMSQSQWPNRPPTQLVSIELKD